MKIALLSLLLSAFSPLQSSKRKVLLFSSDNTLLQQQQSILNSDAKGLEERDITVQAYLLNEQNKSVFTQYKVLHAPFTFILIGKDGGEKLRSTQLVTTAKLFGLIDKMPMRQSEMKRH